MQKHEHKLKQYYRANQSEKLAEHLNDQLLVIKTATKNIVVLDTNNYVKEIISIDTTDNLAFTTEEIVLPLNYKVGYYKFDEKTNKLVIDYRKKKEYDDSIIII